MRHKQSAVKNRKRLARLKREMQEMEQQAYKYDLDERRLARGERISSRYENHKKEVAKLRKKK